MPLYTTDAIVLKSINLGEADKIVTFFTRKYGKIQGVAKQSRRVKSRFGASLEPLTHINLIYFGKEHTNLYKINSCDILDAFSRCKDDFDRLRRGLFILDLVNSAMREWDENLKIFELFLNAMEVINSGDDVKKLAVYLDAFSLRFLSIIGFAPKLTGCIYCNKNISSKSKIQNKIGFHVARGGIICSECLDEVEDVIGIREGIINFMKKAVSTDITNLKRLNLSPEMERELHKVIKNYIYAHVNKEIKSYNLLDI